MKRCLELAKNGLGRTYPNPLVGCVLVYQDQIIGEGWHQKAGEPHAEVHAINSVKDKNLLTKCTLYVNLEPCSHTGRTPACSDLILAHKIPKVIIGSVDPNPQVSGRGIQKLKEAGVHVYEGVLKAKCDALNRRFFTFHRQNRPYIILKWAQSKDGFIAPERQDKGKPFWITRSDSQQLVHKWRSEEQAILIGKNTVLKDNPKLNTRHWYGDNPVRLLIDPNLESYSHREKLFFYDGQIPSIVFCSVPEKNQENLAFFPVDFQNKPLHAIMKELYLRNIQSLIVEGGTHTLQKFIDQNFWDEARVFIGDVHLQQGIAAPHFAFIPRTQKKLSADLLKLYSND